MQDVAFVVALNMPLAQAAHTRSLLAAPAVVTDCPAAQTVHAAHDVAFVVVLKVPLAHGEQTRSLVRVPALITNWPIAQTVHG